MKATLLMALVAVFASGHAYGGFVTPDTIGGGGNPYGLDNAIQPGYTASTLVTIGDITHKYYEDGDPISEPGFLPITMAFGAAQESITGFYFWNYAEHQGSQNNLDKAVKEFTLTFRDGAQVLAGPYSFQAQLVNPANPGDSFGAEFFGFAAVANATFVDMTIVSTWSDQGPEEMQPGFHQVGFSVVPEPSVFGAIAGVGLIGLAVLRRRRI